MDNECVNMDMVSNFLNFIRTFLFFLNLHLFYKKKLFSYLSKPTKKYSFYLLKSAHNNSNLIRHGTF